MAARKTLALIASATLVAGHGYVTNATIGGDDYEFFQPYTDPYKSPVPDRVSRKITGNGPVEDVTSSAIQCNADTAPAALVAEAAAGSDVELFWTLWPESHVGPTITYMAKCDNDDCTTYEPGTDAVWFKIQENGREGTSDTWGATALMTAGGSVTYTIPECIEPGSYLVRHEIIALHSAYSYPGAQFYPGCHQIKVTGGGSTVPSDLVAFPGAYKGADAGITYDAYKAAEYTIPGPALFSCSGSSSSGSSSGSSGSAASSAAAPASTLATVTKASSAAPSSTAVTTAAAAVVTDAADDDACDVPATTVASTSSVAANVAAAPTSDASDDEACDAEETVTATITSSAPAETGSSDECPAEEEEPATEEGDDECDA